MSWLADAEVVRVGWGLLRPGRRMDLGMVGSQDRAGWGKTVCETLALGSLCGYAMYFFSVTRNWARVARAAKVSQTEESGWWRWRFAKKLGF